MDLHHVQCFHNPQFPTLYSLHVSIPSIFVTYLMNVNALDFLDLQVAIGNESHHVTIEMKMKDFSSFYVKRK